MSSPVEHVVISHPDENHLEAGSLRRAPRISQEDVFRAADALIVEGHRPTIDRVRMRLGRGSPNTINDHLDAWWGRLGSRLRDLPDRQFPQLPERVAASLQQLWNEALEGAHEALRASSDAREAGFSEREQQLVRGEAALADAERLAAGRTAALEANLALAREQLVEANRRAAALEEMLRERDADAARLRARFEALEQAHTVLAQKLEMERASHVKARARLEERHAATEARWLTEVDRARQALKDSERRVKELQGQLARALKEREGPRAQLAQARAELTAAHAVRSELQERIRLLSPRPPAHAAPARNAPRPARARKTKSATRKGAS